VNAWYEVVMPVQYTTGPCKWCLVFNTGSHLLAGASAGWASSRLPAEWAAPQTD